MSARPCTQTPSSAPADAANQPGTEPVPAHLARARLSRLVAALFSASIHGAADAVDAAAIESEIRDAAETLGIDPALAVAALRLLASPGGLHDAIGSKLGHTVQGECSPYQLEYARGDVFRQSQSLADLAGFYRAFGFEATGPDADRGDDIVTQWEFLSVLAFKHACAVRDADDAAATCRAAERSFLSEHAAAWMPAFFSRLRRAGAPDCVADLAEAVLRQWCAARNVQLGPSWLELREPSEDDATVTCGAPDQAQVELGPRMAAAMESVG